MGAYRQMKAGSKASEVQPWNILENHFTDNFLRGFRPRLVGHVRKDGARGLEYIDDESIERVVFKQDAFAFGGNQADNRTIVAGV
mmetsp:Transcript_41182/g.66246  ORF Transcript_41182/g.66246 Transcript_41182/m.66246 type:complete len:85 (+) Transcript_41182:816-1070(+)|eukprot:jgi/Bigna1/145870/aug1.105_g20578